MNQLPHEAESLNEARQGRSMVVALMAIAGITAAWFSGAREAFWVAVLVLVTDLFLVALIAIVAEQITTAEPRKRWQLSLGKLLQLTAATGVYLGIARSACLNSIPGSGRMDITDRMTFLVVISILVAISFPVILSACEGLIWVLVDVRKANARRSRDDRRRTH